MIFKYKLWLQEVKESKNVSNSQKDYRSRRTLSYRQLRLIEDANIAFTNLSLQIDRYASTLKSSIFKLSFERKSEKIYDIFETVKNCVYLN